MFLEHVNMTVRDLDESVKFYEDLLGYRVRWRGTTSDGQRAAHVGDDQQYLAFFEAADGDACKADYSKIGMNHVGIVVEDLEAMRRKLTAMWVNPHHFADYEPGRRLYFLDPSGLEVELVEYDGNPSALRAKAAGG